MATKRTPDRKVTQGSIAAVITGAITTFITQRFHLTTLEASLIPTLVSIGAYFAGSYIAPYEPRIEEIIAYVKKLMNEVPSA
jgi:hypothetical protein